MLACGLQPMDKCIDVALSRTNAPEGDDLGMVGWAA
jgi:hypothetical protein